MPHHWMTIAVGRVCTACSLAQQAGTFDDDEPCADKYLAKVVKPKPSKT